MFSKTTNTTDETAPLSVRYLVIQTGSYSRSKARGAKSAGLLKQLNAERRQEFGGGNNFAVAVNRVFNVIKLGVKQRTELVNHSFRQKFISPQFNSNRLLTTIKTKH